MQRVADPLVFSLGEEELASRPKFSALLRRLQGVLDLESGMTHAEKEEEEQLRFQLEEAKARHLRSSLMLAHLLSISARKGTTQDATCAWIRSSLSASSASVLDSFLGLSREEILGDSSSLASHADEALSRLQVELEEQATALAEFLDPSEGGQHSALTVAKARQLPALVASLQQQKEASREGLVQAKGETFGASIQYIETLSHILEESGGLAKDALLPKEGRNFVFQNTFVQWLAQKLQTTILKMTVVQQELLQDTYTPEKIRALHNIRRSIEGYLEEQRVALQQAEDELARYQALTSSGDFGDVVSDYTHLQKIIREKERNLQDLTGGDEEEQHQ